MARFFNRTRKSSRVDNGDGVDDDGVVDDESRLRSMVLKSKAESTRLMEKDLKSYLNKMGRQATFKGWIAHDYPENVDIDQRIISDDSDWVNVWNKVYDSFLKKRRGFFGFRFTARGLKRRSKERKGTKRVKKRRTKKYR